MRFKSIKRSQLYFIISFFSLIVIGLFMLKLPFVSHKNGLSWIDAIFTSTSAVCVTGLVTVPTSGFNPAGQLIILALIQIGGIGFMTLTASIILLMGRGVSFDNRKMLSYVSDDFPVKSIEQLLKTVVTYTFIIEGIGAVLLSTGFMFEGKPFFYSIYLGIFHSISAFCNAGFSIFDESLIGSSIFVKIVISTLIICGGLGFYVIYDLYNFRRGRKTYRIHTRLVLITTMVLILTGTLAIKLIETHKAFDISWIDAYFQSVTTRTAGFNSVDLTLLHPSSILIMTVLMLIGASPGSTGGGMKTTTAAVIFISIYNTFKGNPTVMIFRRRIPLSSILKAFSIMFTFILLTIIGVIAIAGVENTTLSVAVFEAVSALGTVGLSLGLTAQAGAMTKIVLIILMFVGRVGPFTFFLFLLSREKSSQIEYPEERVIMG